MKAGWLRGLPAVAALLLLPGAGPAHAADAQRWFDGGRPGAQAHQAVALLADAPTHGLQAEDYAADALRQAVAAATQGPAPDAAAIGHIEQGLDAAMTRYLSDLHRGRVDPGQVGGHYDPPPRPGFDAAQRLREAVQQGRLADAVRDAAPHLSQYELLRAQLAAYRRLQGDEAWANSLPPLPGGADGKLEPGQAWAGLPRLARRLALLGDLPQAAPVPERYDAALVAAVRAFQRRHGLADDGVIGRATWAQLQVAPEQRVRQIGWALERLRWTPLLQAPRMVVVNIPEFVLRAYEVHDGRTQLRLTTKVIVGKAFDTRTPLIDEPMRFIEFSPYWNVPPSIARGETVPKLRRDPGYWAREGFEFVAGDGRVVTALSAQGLDAVLAGQWRIRQRPGPRNALGDIKFVFPNRENIYLHHTPAVALFGRPRRDFSHGCIRVEQPVALAGFVLQDEPRWTEERIRAAMERGTSSTLELQQPVQVLIAYGTALVKDGRMHFYDDLYGLDRRLDEALRQRPPLGWRMR